MSTEPTGTEVFEDVDPDPDAVLAEFDVESPDDLAEDGGAHDPVPADDAVDDTTAAELFADLEAVETDPDERDSTADGDAAASSADRTVDIDSTMFDDSSSTASDAPDATGADETDRSIDDASIPALEDFEAEFVGQPAVTVRDDGVLETTAAELSAVESTEPSDLESDADESAAVETADDSGSFAFVGSPADATDSVDSASHGRSGSLTVTDSTGGMELVGPDPTPTRITDDAFGSAAGRRVNGR